MSDRCVVYEDPSFRIVHIGEHPYDQPLIFEASAGRDAMGHPVWQSLNGDDASAVLELCRRLAQKLFLQKDGCNDVSSLD